MELPDFFGVDLGTHSIKVAQIKRYDKTRADLLNTASVPIELSLLEDSSDQGMQQFANKLREVREAAGIRTVNCVAGIPEAPVFSRLLSLPQVEDVQLEESVHWELKPLIPIPIADVDVAFMEIGNREVNGQKFVDVFAVAAPKSLTSRFQRVMEMAGLNLLALETEALANARSVFFNYGDVDTDFMVFDFGSQSTDLVLSRHGVPVFTQHISTGSEALTKAIAGDYGIDMQQAEQYKRTYGIDYNQGDGKIAKSLEPVMQILVQEMQRALTYYREKIGDSGATRIYMVGEGASLPGLPIYLRQNLGLDAVITNPVAKIKLLGTTGKDLQQTNVAGLSVAVGLGLKDT